jgi:uncharacterized membrane protein
MTPQNQQQQNPLQSVGGDTVREQDKIQLVLAYLGCLALIPFLTVKDSEYVKWHAKQGLVLLAGEVVIGVGLSIVLSIVGVGLCLGPVVNLGFFVLSIFGIMKAMKGERYRIPVVADLADKF